MCQGIPFPPNPTIMIKHFIKVVCKILKPLVIALYDKEECIIRIKIYFGRYNLVEINQRPVIGD